MYYNIMNIHDFIETHRKGFDVIKGLENKFEYYEFEKRFINHINDNRFSITKKSRRMHISTLLANYVAWQLLFGKPRIVITFVAGSIQMSRNFNEKVCKAIRDYNINIIPEHRTKLEIILGNGSRLRCVTATPDSFCGWTSDIIIIDECAFIEKLGEIMGASTPTLDTEGKLILVSTTNGLEDFYRVWERSIKGQSDFKNLSLNYKDNPRFNKNEQWFQDMCRALNMDKRQIQSELLAEFATWRPKPNKSVKLQIRVSEEMLYDMQIMMSNYDISDYSKYVRKLINDNISSLKRE